MNKKYLIAIIAIIIICAAAFALTNSNYSSNGSVSIDANALEDRGNLVVDSESLDEHNGYYHSDNADTNSILIKNGGNLKLANSAVNKTGDTATSGDDADFYGVNSAVLVNTNGTLDISNVEITTDSKGSNGIFVTNANASSSSRDNPQQGSGEGSQPPEAMGNGGGEGGQPPEMPDGNGGEAGQAPEAPDGQGGGEQPGQSTIEGSTEANINNVKITTHSDKSRGLDATYNGAINAENVIINTDGQSCAALATDRGEGQVHVKNSEINTGVSKTSGRGSPLIYSTGNITAENTKGTSYVSQIACIEGKNSIELTNCDMTGFAEGNRQDGDTYVDLGGIFIYQSMSGDADVGTSTFTAKNSKLAIAEDSPVSKEAPMFHITNTACVINLENTELSFNSGVFLESSGQNQWGNEGSNGGTCELNTENENIAGNVIVDAISSLNWNMKNTQFKGAINSTGNTTVSVGEGSTWTLTGDSTVSSLELNGNIEYGEYTLTVDGKTYNSSNQFK
ncbi:MAG: hypothetical protein E7Z79_04470 [Methanobrevibacter thaueri]|uniref:Uncharacterized protein n=1 Tax=Methanobrevibacter thaueri TaxID=190975 RepID=A0A8T3V7S1_9EURY|nr:hypothetical protein [Methanobrevibacter thaueri]MBE6501676.1 hypothetical protein [Methanobrevibacter thaueri]